MEEDKEVLRRFGVKVPETQVDEIMKVISGNPAYKEELEKFRVQVKAQATEDDFLHVHVRGTHKDKLTAPNGRVSFIDGTYLIRAIDPQQIKSLTERAFFNSFNIERNNPNDLASQRNVVADDEQQLPKAPIPAQVDQQLEPKGDAVKVTDIQKVESSCYCGQQLNDHWVRCDNQQNCKGSSWYHYSCVGFTEKDNVEGRPFVCKFCKDQLAHEEPPTTKRRKV